jgi:two-component system, LytTR family, response regulator
METFSMATHGPERIRVLVVDDEAPARQRLVDLLCKDSQICNICEAESGIEALDVIRELRPDVVFLDVQMPELDGLGVIDAVGADLMPLTIFVTAYDQHAVRAFEANALDYLLKPFSDERFESAMARLRSRLAERNLREFGERVAKLVSSAAARERGWDRLVVKAAGISRFLRVAEIDWIEAAGVYVNLHVGGKELLHRASLNDLEEKLDPRRFVRIHRSAIVNIESILHLEPMSHGEFEAVMKDGTRAKISRTYRPQLEKRLRQSL